MSNSVTFPIKQKVVLSKKVDNAKTYLVLIPITAEDFDNVRNNKRIIVEANDETFVLSQDNCSIASIEVDENGNGKDMGDFAGLSWFASIPSEKGLYVPCNYDYKTHTAVKVNGVIQQVETWDAKRIMRFAHASLNKPKYIAMFNMNKI